MQEITMTRAQLLHLVSNAIAYGNNELYDTCYEESYYEDEASTMVSRQMRVGIIPEFKERKEL